MLTAPLCNFCTTLSFRTISRLSWKILQKIKVFFIFVLRFFRGVPESRPNHRHVYAVSDDWQTGVGSPVCLSCNLPKNISQKCQFNDATFSQRFVINKGNLKKNHSFQETVIEVISTISTNPPTPHAIQFMTST